MNHHINPIKAGLTFGKFLGGLHIVWVTLVALGWAQALLDFSLWAHMVSIPVVVVKTFDFSAAVTVVVVATIVGYAVGYMFARLWNWVHRS